MATYDHIGQSYDSTRRADPYLPSRLIHHLNAKPGDKILDVACGAGNYTIALAQAGLQMHGIDQSSVMLEYARKKSNSHLVQWHLGDAEHMPFADKTFVGALCTLAIHHFNDTRPIFAEVYRVLARGRFVIFTADPEQMKKYWLNVYFPQMMSKSIARMSMLAAVEQNLRNAGFKAIHKESFNVTNELQDLFLFSGKHRPQIYLDPRVRAGISSFADLADADEVELGLQQLAADIDSGKISEVIATHPNESDYLFVIAEK
ncbi:methyltransferase domain-containing protein [Candidatus Acetothermia bacterium]|nr:methyltransferase domain-containing protein [Candidatus Acetothermia bacterium]